MWLCSFFLLISVMKQSISNVLKMCFASVCVNVCFRCSWLRCSKGRVLFCCWQRSMKIPLFNYFHYTLWREESRNYCTRAKRWEENVKILLLMREKKLHLFAKSLNWEKNYKKILLTTQQNPKSNQKRQWREQHNQKSYKVHRYRYKRHLKTYFWSERWNTRRYLADTNAIHSIQNRENKNKKKSNKNNAFVQCWICLKLIEKKNQTIPSQLASQPANHKIF